MASVPTRICIWLASMLVLLPLAAGAANVNPGAGIGGPITGPRPISPISPYNPVLIGITTLESRLGFTIIHPLLVFDNGGTLTYTAGGAAGGGLMEVLSDPLAIQLTPGSVPFAVLPFAGDDFLSLSLVIDETTGEFIEGVPGDDFQVVGQADINNDGMPDVGGVLLTGEVVEYMGEDSGGTTDFHDFRVRITGGELAYLYTSGQIGINLTSEMSNFNGSYTQNFSGESKGTLGRIPCKAVIGNFVWIDTNQNGIQDPGEPGIPDVEVILTDQFGGVQTTTTNSDGTYKFADLCKGTYTIEVNDATIPPGLDPTLINAPGSTQDNDSNDPDGTPVVIPADSGEDLTYDFGYIPVQPAALGDFVWLDSDMDGFQDPGEPGIEGVMVNLYTCGGAFVGTMVTDINGFYFFNDLAPGCYQVEFILPPGLVFSPMDNAADTLDSDPDPTTGFTDPVNLAPGEVNPDVDAGMFPPPPPAELGDRFWLDENGNGIQDPGEPGIPGVPVDLIDCTTGAVLDSTTTDATGMYLFDNLDAGCYQVQFTAPQDCVITLQDEGGDDTVDNDADAGGLTGQVNLAQDESNLTVDGGCYFTAGLGDFVWNDQNMDGFQDPGEPGIPGLTVVLLDEFMVPTGLSTITGPAGDYQFLDLAPGSYFVQFTAPAGFVFTVQDAAADDVDSDANGTGKTDKITLSSGEYDPTIDAGVFEPPAPAISIEKSTNGFDADNPTGPFVPNGGDVLWEYVVTNIGNTTLFDIVVLDDQGVAVTCPDDTLVPGDSFTCTGNGTGTVDQYMNVGSVCGTDGNTEVCDDDPSHYFGSDPSIDIEKATNGEDADLPTGPYITPGGSVTWTYVVTNTGNVDLSNVVVTDDQGVTVTCPLNFLTPGQMMTCMANGTAVAGQYANVGSVVGEPPVGDPVDDMDPSHYFGALPDIDIEKLTNGIDADDPNAGDAPQIMPGDTVTWTYIVTNTGNVTLNDIAVIDNQGVTVTCPDTTLEPDDSFECTASGLAEDLLNTVFETVPGLCGGFPNTPLYENIGLATGESVNGEFVEDADPSHYCNPPDPRIDIEKLTNGIDADDPNAGDAPQIAAGDTVTWTYIVTNTGNVPLDNVSVTDDQGVSVSCPATTLNPGDSFECTASGVADDLLTTGFTTVPGLCGGYSDTQLYENMGTATGETSNGDFVEDVDASHYCNPPTPDIDIEKLTNGVDADDPNAGDAPQIAAGDTVTWTYIVTNTGNVPLDNVSVTDDQGVSVSCPATTLNPGDSFECTASGVADDLLTTGFTTVPGLCGGYSDTQLYENMGTASGETSNGDFVEDVDASHYCNPPTPDIDIEKLTNGVDADDANAGDAPQILPGDPVMWTYIVTNTGNVPLTNVSVTDDQGVAVSCPATTLAPGDSFTCTASGFAENLLSTGFTTVQGLCGDFPMTPLYENMGTATGETSNGDFVEDVDASHYCNPPTPDIDIEKLTNGVNADDPNAGDAPQILPGDPVMWTYIVTNTGNVPLTGIVVTDDQGVAVTCPADTLLPGDSFTCTANGVADDLMSTGFTTVPGLCGGYTDRPLYENMGMATGSTVGGVFVQDVDASHYCNPPTPDIDIEKLTNGVDADDPNAGDAPQILPGDPVMWTYLVTNTGNVPLDNVSVNDDQGVAVSCPATTLNPGDSFTCTASGTADDLMTTGFTTVLGLCGIRPNVPLYENMGTATGSTVTGAFVQDVDPSHYCNPEPCALEVSKTCFIPMPAPNDYVCDKPIESLTMIWDGASAVRIKAYKGDTGAQLLADIDDIQPGEEITVMGYTGSPNDVTWEVFTSGTSNKIGESVFHLSCSDDEMDGPEDCGMNEGNGKSNDSSLINLWLLEGIVDSGGVLDCTPTPTTGDQTECEFQVFPASCETGDVDFLTLQYTGGGCGASDNAQDDHVCSGNVDGSASATFTDDDGNSVTLNPGDTVTIARNLAKNMTLSNAGGTETNELHTSCSQPIQAGDIYGSLTLVQIDGMGIGTDVNYSYVITNSSNVDIVNLSAIDVPLGPIPGAPSSLGAGQSVTLNASAFITETTTNIAIVDGLTADGQMCNGQASSTVTILPPPPCDVDGEGLFDHFHSDHVVWKLTNNGTFTATVESIVLSWPAANGDLIEVKLNGTIFNGNLPPTSGTLDSGDFVADVTKRQIAPGDTKSLELKFDNDIVGVPGDYSITVNFEEGCSVTFENTGLPFECTDKITELNMSWDGAADPVRVVAYKGSVGSAIVLDQSGIGIGDEIFVTSLEGAPNDVFWEVFSGGTKIGESKFHLSCSDSEMNGAEDCGNREGNGKGNDSGFINDWILEGLTDGDGPFDCDNLP